MNDPLPFWVIELMQSSSFVEIYVEILGKHSWQSSIFSKVTNAGTLSILRFFVSTFKTHEILKKNVCKNQFSYF